MKPAANFRDLCRTHHLVATHQRQVIYETVMSLPGHPSPEAIYAEVQSKIPSISLATVYKNIQTFLDSGVFKKVSTYHGALRVEPNLEAHHHLVCVRCKCIMDVDEDKIEPIRLRQRLPKGFQVTRIAVDILGVCENCASAQGRKTKA